jgi:hypothetical protein
VAHFAQLNSNNEVIYVAAVDNKDIVDSNGDESEAVGVAFLQKLFGADTVWKQTSYNASFRGNYATVGGTYDPDRNVFISKAPHKGWVLNLETFDWEPPTPAPENGRDALGFLLNEVWWDNDLEDWKVSYRAKVYYAKYEDGAFVDIVAVFREYILDKNGDEDDTLGLSIATESLGVGEWKRVPTPPDGAYRFDEVACDWYIVNPPDDYNGGNYVWVPNYAWVPQHLLEE